MSHDTKAKLVYMANQIATFFKSQPADEAVQGVATHINKFWEPRMRRQLFEILEKEENGLDALVLQAAPMIRKPEPEANQAR
ncbi:MULTISPECIES: formate dehydrogenase subunit delta [unclassified Rhizobium]|uniref:formate dehydrogenase subunit delta n=1 Tax=unclassified Rhizobium TaxID=2613769 RepID=UPI0007EB1C59|nr:MULTISPECIES: formate dehydrogenase subunit delta [unclassified Rhizobium]ANM12542.1 FdsD family formate dehydrogenase delta subunit protein [Rhizobium sp. N324]ANM18945.1 FdsD family formate dehydrogenase delta subunit protein [Rhizobium sp. N541]ANM25330.1 FdsD family formate dehydrogenase delta subunit protein [Rhizobium sp. N941]OWV90016.1 formate dehydrogenase [Rhizobium sp. N122]OYD01717.1 FdsD family formate dehydrogenase delta subunit protein [Rhizobium sp. N4311]